MGEAGEGMKEGRRGKIGEAERRSEMRLLAIFKLSQHQDQAFES